MSRRDQIKMSAAEALAFLAEERTVVCATVGPRGWPHLMPLWYVLRATTPASASDAEAASDAKAVNDAEAASDTRTANDAGAAAPTGADDDTQLWAWTYGVSQKVRNLERDARATLQVEAGELYHELRGVMIECEVIIHRDLETVSALGHEILTRNAAPRGEPPVQLPADAQEAITKQAAKRVGLQFVELRRATWDHRKLGGIY